MKTNKFKIPWNKGKKGLQIAWNKGLNAKEDERVAKYANKQKGQKRKSISGNKNPAKRKDVRKKLVENNSMKHLENRKKISISNKKNWKNEEVRKRRIKSMKGIKKTEIHKKKLSIARKKLLTENPEILKRMLSNFNGKKTDIEKKIEEVLVKNYIEYKYNFPILNYLVDFAIIKKKLVIECDGEYWHDRGDRIKSDIIRQNKIENCGWKVIRFKGNKIKTNIKYCENEILKNFIDNDIVRTI